MRRPPAGTGGSASLGESAARQLRLRWEKELSGVTALGFLPAGSLVVVEDLEEKGSRLTTLDPAWVERWRFTVEGESVTALEVTRDGSRLALLTQPLRGHDLYLYDPSGREVLHCHSADGLAPVLTLSPDGGAVAVVEGGNRLLYLGEK